jgi:predicted RNase H-like HicB family nuclease
MSDPVEPTILYEEDEDGWIVASIPEVPGVFSQGRTRDEARANVLDALQLMTSPEPDTIDESESDRPHA